MAKQVSELSVFVASPGDVGEERERLEDVVRELNLQWSKSKGIRLELVRWETQAYPSVSSDPQAVINEQIGQNYDIFLGILWTRFGMETPRAGSGTEEEFNRAYQRHRETPNALRIMIYFKTGDVKLTDIDVGQLAQVRQFQERLGPKGTLFWEFGSSDDFPALVRMHLSHCVEDWGKNWGDGVQVPAVAHCGQTDSADDAEDEGFLDLIEATVSSFEQLADQSGRICQSTETLGAKMTERTGEIEQAQDADGSFNLKAAKRICNAAADDLDAYATIMDAEVPLFSATFMRAIDSYAKAAAILPDFSARDGETAKQVQGAISTAASLRCTMDEAGQSLAGFRQAIANHPRMTTQYNRAKRHALAVLDRLLTEMKSGSDRLLECQKSLGAIRAELPPASTQQTVCGDGKSAPQP